MKYTEYVRKSPLVPAAIMLAAVTAVAVLLMVALAGEGASGKDMDVAEATQTEARVPAVPVFASVTAVVLED